MTSLRDPATIAFVTHPTVTPAPTTPPALQPAAPDLREYGAPKGGARQSSDRRLFMQLLVYTGCLNHAPLAEALAASRLESVLYLNVNDPRGVGVLLLSEDPAQLIGPVRALLTAAPFAALIPQPACTMLGRTYALGHEADLEDWLLAKPRRVALNPALPWAVWYPLRRKPEFELLTKEEQRDVLMEHGRIGVAYGTAGLAQDIRLACHGLDAHDNEFLLGIASPQLAAISRLIQDMRKTRQTAEYMQSLGPFFVGHVAYQTPLVRA